MWVYYQNKDDNRQLQQLTIRGSGFTITVNGKDHDHESFTNIPTITPDTSVVYTRGEDGDAIQFFVPTTYDYIQVVVANLGNFEFTAPPATKQDAPLEPHLL